MATRALDRQVPLSELRLGDLLAEGGEGKVYELPTRPHLVFKAYRDPTPRPWLAELVDWLQSVAPEVVRSWVGAATAWPEAVVTGRGGEAANDTVAGVLLPRAPRRFALRHRDGSTRLATLSYLTADPAYRAVAYGLSLPEPMSPLRVGLVYALARLLAAFEEADPRIGHGDLSTKNVLWSLQRGPEVFVLDCDNCELFESAPVAGPVRGGEAAMTTAGGGVGAPPSGGGWGWGPVRGGEAPMTRRRAMTPNWEDPAVPAGSNPTVESDRYSLALIFLRVVGAANFPMQARQRQAAGGAPVTVDVSVPSQLAREPLLGYGGEVLELCARGLSMSEPAARPAAAAWLAPLEALLDVLGAADVMRSVWSSQGGIGSPASPIRLAPSAVPSDVIVRPVPAAPRLAPRWSRVAAPYPAAARRAGGLAPTPWRRPSAVPAAVSAGATTPPQPVLPQIGYEFGRVVAWWIDLHRRALSRLWGRHRRGFRALLACAGVDLVVGLVLVFIAAMVVSPFVGL